jgi:hypothetical protein
MKRIIPIIILLIAFLCGTSYYSFALPIFNPVTGHWYDKVNGNWFTAENSAILLGGHLVTINDEAEQQWLITNFGGNTLYWIGFTDRDNEGTWVWVSGEPVTYTNWAPSEPNNYLGNEDWAVMNWGNNGKWNDLRADGCNVGIAEWAPVSSVPEPSTMLLLGSALIGFAGAGYGSKKFFKK